MLIECNGWPGCVAEELTPFGVVVRPAGKPDRLPPPSDELRAAVLRFRLVVFRGFRPFWGKSSLATFAAGLGPVLDGPFGSVFEVVEQAHPQSYMLTSGGIPFHWDGAFARQAPWLQLLQCVETTAVTGGDTFFTDTARVWRNTPTERREEWRRVEVEYASKKLTDRGGSVRVPLVATHPVGGETVLRYLAPPDAATVDLNTTRVTVCNVPEARRSAFLADLHARLSDPAVMYTHTWESGDVLIADNAALLHGRHPFRSPLPRRLWRVQVLPH